MIPPWHAYIGKKKGVPRLIFRMSDAFSFSWAQLTVTRPVSDEYRRATVRIDIRHFLVLFTPQFGVFVPLLSHKLIVALYY